MPRLLRLLCVCLGVTVMVAVQMHGVVNSQHRIEHGLQFPGVSYEDAADLAHDHDQHHDHGHGHEHGHETADDDLVSDQAMSIDMADNSGETPFTHHHHNGGDIHVALAAPVHPAANRLFAPLDLGPALDALPPGALLDAPLQPPRQNA